MSDSFIKPGNLALVAVTLVGDGNCETPYSVKYRGHQFFVDLSDLHPYTEPDTADPTTGPITRAIAELGEVTGLTGGDLLAAVEELVHNAIRRIRAAATRVIDVRSAALEEIEALLGVVPPDVLDRTVAYMGSTLPISPFEDGPSTEAHCESWGGVSCKTFDHPRRDPRTSPQPGDVRAGAGYQHTVTAVGATGVLSIRGHWAHMPPSDFQCGLGMWSFQDPGDVWYRAGETPCASPVLPAEVTHVLGAPA